MIVATDLHSHSPYAGGAKNIDIRRLAKVAKLKGVNIIGTGDCLFAPWIANLKNNIEEIEEGLFGLARSKLETNQRIFRFVLQTEIVITLPADKGRRRLHLVILFPDFTSIKEIQTLFGKWHVKNTIGRPYLVCHSVREVSKKLKTIAQINPWLEFIPAHVMTPEGVFGSKNKISSWKEIFGDFVSHIYAVETGLSADPTVLSLIPELENINLISSSDFHSANYDKLGREMTILDIEALDYKNIIKAIRKNRINKTIEFPPSEGKYFLTGHRKNRPGHSGKPCYWSPKFSSSAKLCPICNRKTETGVLERAFELRKIQSGKRKFGQLKNNARPFLHVVPLFEILKSRGLGEKEYETICSYFGNELNLWESSVNTVKYGLNDIKNISAKVISEVLAVKDGTFCFDPPGYDGEFGKIKIGRTIDLFKINST